MKVIDLLNKIANGEEVPKEIIYKGKTYYAEFNSSSEKSYYCDDEDNLLLDSINSVVQLNDEVEIIEEDKKIEKIWFSLYEMERVNKEVLSKIEKKINEIIDRLNKGE